MATFGTSVTIAQLASFFQVGQSTDEIFSDSVLSNKVNKWSKRKPIHYSKTSPLNDTEMKGMTDDISNGIIYGLKVGAARRSPETLHSATWEYVGKPQGTVPSSPYRVDDFWGYEYEYDDGPTVYGSGVSDGDRIRYDSAFKTIEVIWQTEKTTIVDMAEIMAALGTNSADYSQIYLCVMIDGYIRCCINNTAGGGVYPIMHNGVKCISFTIPEATRFGYSETSAHSMTLFFASKTDVDTLVPAMKTEWVSVFGLAFNQPLISCVGLINKQIYLVRALAQYITAFDISYNKGFFNISYTKGNDWNSPNAYRVVFSVKDSSGTTGPATYIAIDKTTAPLVPSAGAMLKTAGFVPTGSAQTFTFTASFQVQQVSGGSWTATEFSDSEVVTLTTWVA